MNKTVTLYILTHRKTGLKYFGKTTRFNTVKQLQEKYHGGGSYWNTHLRKHGKDIDYNIYGIYNLNEVEEIALKFSEDNNIVKALNESGDRKGKKIWANLKPENGLDGGSEKGSYKGYKHTKEAKLKMSKQRKGRTLSKEWKDKISESGRGIKKPNYNLSEEGRLKKLASAKKGIEVNTANIIRIFDSVGRLKFICEGNFFKICDRHILPKNQLRLSYANKTLVFSSGKKPNNVTNEYYEKYKGWYAIKY